MKRCPMCSTILIEGSRYCHMCGVDLGKVVLELENQMSRGEIPLYQYTFHTTAGIKTIEVWCRDITDFPEQIGLLTISAYKNSYSVYNRSVIGALYQHSNLNVSDLLEQPYIDLRDQIGCWMSEEIILSDDNPNIHRIGCIEFEGSRSMEYEILQGIKGYFHMLDLAADAGVPMKTLAMPLIGTGVQRIHMDRVLIPLINEVVSMLKRNDQVKKVIFVEKSMKKAKQLADSLKNSYQLSAEPVTSGTKRVSEEAFVFISYTTHGDTYATEMLRDLLKERDIECWYAPDAIRSGEYAHQIVEAISRCTHFICIISKNSMSSHHVLNELNLAFQHLNEGVSILPFRLDDESVDDAFRYYLSTMQWNYGYPPPFESKAREFIGKIFPESPFCAGR